MAVNGVREVREYIKAIGGFKSVTIIERATNMGLAASIIDGVTRLSAEHGQVIVLEDDLVTSPHFLSYMNDGLTRYEKDERVMQIAGYMFLVKLAIEDDALFLPFISSWGWATWQRAWRHFDPHAKNYQRLVNDVGLQRQFDLSSHYKYFKMLRAQQRGKIDSWAIRWYLSVFFCKGLVLYPRKTLVHNLGVDGSGVNCVASSFVQDYPEKDFRVTAWPSSIEISAHAQTVYQNMPSPKLSTVSILNRMKNLLGMSG